MSRDRNRDAEVMPHRSKKPTRVWCKGRVGTPHVLERREGVMGWSPSATCRWRKVYDYGQVIGVSTTHTLCTEADVCANCGKQFSIEREECHLLQTREL